MSLSTPKTTLYLSNGTKLVDIFPLENNGPVSLGSPAAPNQSIPNEISDIDYATGSIRIAGDLADRFISITGTNFSGLASQPTISLSTSVAFDALMTQGLAVGMFAEYDSATVPNYTKIVSIDSATQTITLSNNLVSAVSNQPFTFCFPFNIIDLDPATPSPYIGEYGAKVSSFDGKSTSVVLSTSTPLSSASFDVANVVTGTNGVWIIQGLTNAAEVFYPQSSFMVTGNSFTAANGSYTVAQTIQSTSYVITDVVQNLIHNDTVLTVQGNVGEFFIASIPAQQLIISGNTSHNVGLHVLNGAHDIKSVGAYNAGSNSTEITISSIITGVSGPADGTVQPAIVTSAITVTGLIPSGTTKDGLVIAGAPLQESFVLPPAITPTTPHNYIITWRIAGDYTTSLVPGHTVTIKNNNYYQYKQLTIASTNYITAVASGVIGGVTEVRTNITDPNPLTPIINQTGSLIYPAPAVPYGHVQYSVLIPASPLQLVGRGTSHYNITTTWGHALQNNAIHQLENFANPTAPVSPLDGQFWFDTATPSMNIRFNDTWNGVVSAGAPVAGDIDMNLNSIINLADAVNPRDAVNLQTGDLRYVNTSGDSMSGALNMTTHKITGIADTDIPLGATINMLTANGQDALNMRTADARYVNVDGDSMLGILSMGTHRITNLQDPAQSADAATKSYVDSLSSGIVWVQAVLDPTLFDDTLSAPPVVADPALLVYRSYIVKPTAYAVAGASAGGNTFVVAGDRTTVILPAQYISLVGNTNTASNIRYTVLSTAFAAGNTTITVVETINASTTISGDILHASGAWNDKHGHLMGYNGTQWVDVLTDSLGNSRAVTTGDRFGVFFEVDNDDPLTTMPGGSFAVGSALGTVTKTAAGKIVTVNSINTRFVVDWGTSVGATFPPHTPAEPDAVSVLGTNSVHYGHSYTFRGAWGTGVFNTAYKWIEFAGPSMLVDGAGLRYIGNVLNVGQGTGLTVNANNIAINTTYMNTNYMRRDGTTAFNSDISMGNHRLINLIDPVNPLDAVNKQFLLANFVSSSGLTAMVGDLNMNNYHINNLAAPVVGTDGVNKTYADTKVAKTGDTMTGALTMSSGLGLAFIDMALTNKIINLADPTAPRDGVNLQTAEGRYVKLSGSTMTGILTLSAAPTQPLHAATKQYVDDVAAATIATVQAAIINGGTF